MSDPQLASSFRLLAKEVRRALDGMPPELRPYEALGLALCKKLERDEPPLADKDVAPLSKELRAIMDKLIDAKGGGDGDDDSFEAELAELNRSTP